ncbi:MAG: hypothetical protein QOG62_160 [Thermoleophilaceae bacterium]|nr:hypothetical protein [Thermoleophilaceae bacterium]
MASRIRPDQDGSARALRLAEAASVPVPGTDTTTVDTDAGPDRPASRGDRQHAASERDDTAVARLSVAAGRDRDAARRDERASDDDDAADSRDQEASVNETPTEREHDWDDRRRAADDRRRAADDRLRAADDRQRAADDREGATQERRRLRSELRSGHRLEEEVVELTRSNTELDAFASIAAHDLSAPMSEIAGFANLIHEEYAESLGSKGRGWLERMIRGIERSQALTHSLLVFSRIGGADITYQPVNTADLMEEVVRTLNEAITEAGADVRIAPLPTVMGDRSQLLRLFQNLVGNGVKFGRGDVPTVVVSAERQDDRWHFKVADNGPGIPLKEREHVFKPFKRLVGSERPGTGIGLAICERIVQRHGGEIYVEPGLDGGSRFVFTLAASPHHP